MLLIVAPPKDDVAREFEEFARDSGIAVARLSSATSLSLEVDRSGDAWAQLCVGDTAVTSIFNRGIVLDKEAAFTELEQMAAWWSAIALFQGPVINRPSRNGLLPDLDVLSLAAAVPGLDLAPMQIGSAHSLKPRPAVNAHSIVTGEFLGRKYPVDEERLALFTAFDPARTINLIVAGDRAFATSGRLAIDPQAAAILTALEEELRTRGATFSSATLQVSGAAVEILHASPCPPPAFYQGAGHEVYGSLTGYLCGT